MGFYSSILFFFVCFVGHAALLCRAGQERFCMTNKLVWFRVQDPFLKLRFWITAAKLAETGLQGCSPIHDCRPVLMSLAGILCMGLADSLAIKLSGKCSFSGSNLPPNIFVSTGLSQGNFASYLSSWEHTSFQYSFLSFNGPLSSWSS